MRANLQGMQANTTALERPFELARSQACIRIVEIKRRLKALHVNRKFAGQMSIPQRFTRRRSRGATPA